MERLKLLDCTLRDGGYCNQWKFGKRDACKIMESLQKASVDIIECGYIQGCKGAEGNDTTQFTAPSQVKELIADISVTCVAMVDYGKVAIEDVLTYKDVITAVRVAFHKKDCNEALMFCRQLQENGMRVYVQPMVTLSYSEEEYSDLLNTVNNIKPQAFYIVDSFGSMQVDDIERYLLAADRKLACDIEIGFHGHNNMQMVLANAIRFVELCADRTVIIDTCLLGMGRGAGNLNTEMFAEYCNKVLNKQYFILPLMQIIDEIISRYQKRFSWGYSWAYYISAIQECHPNYATFLYEKKTLNYYELYQIMSRIESKHKNKYDEQYIASLYLDYMCGEADDMGNEERFREMVRGKKVLLLAPGKTISTQQERIGEYIDRENPVIIGVNMDYAEYAPDYIFLSNLRRYHSMHESGLQNHKLIVTSNVPVEYCFMKIPYREVLPEEEPAFDNAGIMVINFLKKYEIEEVALAGYDGYVHQDELNYADENMEMYMAHEMVDNLNKHISAQIQKLRRVVPVRFVTDSRYQEITE